jgi:hypothetical protein
LPTPREWLLELEAQARQQKDVRALRLLYYAAIAFNIWMIVDAARRRAEFYWFLIIFLLGPLGGLAYFLVVKIHDYDLKRLLGPSFGVGGGGKASITELEYRVKQTPSVTNKLALADALETSERYTEAMGLFRDVLRGDDRNLQALHGLARCLMGTGQPAEAAESLEKLLEVDNAFRDYSAALDYAEALWQAGRREDTVDLLEGLVSVSARINHRVALAHYQLKAERTAAARDVLDRALSDYEHSPEFVKRRDRKWAEQARQLLMRLS